MLISSTLLVIGIILLTKGADFFVEGASALALKLKIPQIIIGLTIVAMGTSAPEASVSIVSALKSVQGVAIGNILGSNIANILLILGITSIITILPLQYNTIKYEIPFLGFITILFGFMGYYFHNITRLCAVIFLILFLGFLIYLYVCTKNSSKEDDEIANFSYFKIVLYIVLGIAALVYGSDITVNSAVDIAHKLNISDRIIGLTIVAVGTSLPELVTCCVAAFKKQCDLAVGNIIGSNIFNILFILGITGLIKPIGYSQEFYFDSVIAFLAVLILFIYTARLKMLKKWHGFSFLIMYIAYLLYIILK